MASESSYSVDDLRAIADAGVSLTSELSLEAILQRLVDLASSLVNTRYAAMSVVGRDGGIEQFIFTGISQEQRQRIGNLPRGRGLLGVLLQEGTVIRLDDMRSDHRSAGFPPHHPPMRSLLGVPLVRRGTIIGNLYLSDKRDGSLFSDRDEEIIRLLAVQAAAAIDNAELYQSEHRLAQESKALFEVGRQVSSFLNPDELLASVADRARRLLETDVAAIVLLTPENTTRVAACSGDQDDADKGRSQMLADRAFHDLALAGIGPLVVLDARTDQRLPPPAADDQLVSLICVPLPGKQAPAGTITIGNRRLTTFDERAVELLQALANYTGLAIETARLQEQLESLARLEERERIAMDLHDGVIQSVYAISLHLENASEILAASPGEAQSILDKEIDDLHQVIKDIRSYIFDLRPQVSDVEDLSGALRELAEAVRVNSLISVSTDIPETIDAPLSADQALAIFHIAQESLNNITKHSQASKVQMRFAAEDSRVYLEIEDDGGGFDLRGDRSGERHGLRNMKDRAKAVGANLFLDSEPGHGTMIRVELPVGSGR